MEHAAIRRGDQLVFRKTNWTWHAGERWAILGDDGAGRSLFIEALMGLVPLAQGDLHTPRWETRRTADPWSEPFVLVSPLTQRHLAVQESSFYQSRWHSGLAEGQRTVAQFLSQASVEGHNPFEVDRVRGDRRRFGERQREFIGWLGIRPLRRRKLAHLSNGELRKALLVHALLKSPHVLVLEDPFAGLDAATRRLLHRLIERLLRRGASVLVSTSRAEDLPAAVTHLLIIARHRVVALGPKEEMLGLWRTQFTDHEPLRERRHPCRREWTRRQGCRRSPFMESRAARREPAGEPVLELHDINVTSGRQQILRQVTWTLRAGERWALSGPNGAGKTALLNLIQGDHPQVYAQRVRWFGRTLDSTQALWRIRQQLGWMSPELHLHYPGQWEALDVVCSGYHNTIGLHLSCSPTQRREASRWLCLLGLAAHSREPFGDLSFGQQRLVLLARAVVKRPRLLVLDEPCQGLDAYQRRTVLDTVDAFMARTNRSLIYVTHRATEVPQCITHRLHLRAGRVHAASRVRSPTPQ